MKTTIDIANGLFEEAKKIARRDNTTLKALIEEGLRRMVEEKKRQRAFRLKKVTFKGRGLSRELRDALADRVSADLKALL